MKGSAQSLAISIFVLAIAVMSVSSFTLLKAQVATTTTSSSSASSIYIPPRLCINMQGVTFKISSFNWGIVPGQTTTVSRNSSSQPELLNLGTYVYGYDPRDIIDVSKRRYRPLTIQKMTDPVGTRTLMTDADTGFNVSSVKLIQTAGTDKPGFTMEFKKAIVVLPFIHWGGPDGAMEEATFNYKELGAFTFTQPLGPNAKTGPTTCPN